MTKSERKNFVRDEKGGLTILNLFFMGTLAVTAGVAIDVNNVIKARTQLQAVADAAAHAAMVSREYNDANTARQAAVDLALANMPPEKFGEVLRFQNVNFGDYDPDTGIFTVDNNGGEEVFVLTDRLQKNGNAVSSFLLQFAGIMDWDLRASSIFETYHPTCLMEGFVAEDVVDIQSNNSYFNGFCVHSNKWVEINNNNYFEAGTVVSMPDKDLLVVKTTGNGEPKNEGIDEALREGRWFIKILNRLDEITAGVEDRHSIHAREFVKNYNVVDITKKKVGVTDFKKDRIHKADCNGTVTLEAGTYDSIVFIANCAIKFNNGVHITNSTIITTDTGAKSMSAPQNLKIGLEDDCAPGGGSQLITYGGFEVASKLEVHGSQVIAAGNIEFSANADGIRGASLVAGGRIDGTSNMNFSFCGTGMEHIFAAEYFRMVR